MIKRRELLRGIAGVAATSATFAMFPPAIRRALAIPANRRTGTIHDVEHIVIFMQENRSFDHYFGTLEGVRGFGDRFPIPRPDAGSIVGKNVWYQLNDAVEPAHVVAPFRLDTQQSFDYMRVTGTPHSWQNAQLAWADGKLERWPRFKNDHSLGYFSRADIPFQFAMADAFTLCDAYHCSFQGGTNPNRSFLWTGSNDPLQRGHGPVLYNDYDNLDADPTGGYSWTTYPERLQRAGISWQVYENMDDNFTDNPLAGFRQFRAAYKGAPGSLAALKERGLSTRDLDKLKEDVLNGSLRQVSWIVATAEGSEHPGPSSPAQGADYTAKVLDALTANPEVWSRTVLLLMFDENDGFFDHVPPPAAPSQRSDQPSLLAGASTIDTTGEYHEYLPAGSDASEQSFLHKPYGLGPRVPLYALSPWSTGGWVCSEVFDHTSVIRFVERRFGVYEPNITPWRRAVCGDLTSIFNFADPDNAAFFADLPDTSELAARARALGNTTTPPTPALPELPVQDTGVRPSRALSYELHVNAEVRLGAAELRLGFANTGRSAAVFHVYDRNNLQREPRRYTVGPKARLSGLWDLGEDAGLYDLWVLGPNGFHRHFTGDALAASLPEIAVQYDAFRGDVYVTLRNPTNVATSFVITANAYTSEGPWLVNVASRRQAVQSWSLRKSAHWYDFTVTLQQLAGYSRRFAGRVETGRDSLSDPALGGQALGDQTRMT
jgi:phospholipase C